MHLTARRFFIGPLPEGWVQSHRNQWYKARLSFKDYTSRTTSSAPRTTSFDKAQVDTAPHANESAEERLESQAVEYAEGSGAAGNSESVSAESDETVRAGEQHHDGGSESDETETITGRQGTVEGNGTTASTGDTGRASFVTARETLQDTGSEMRPPEALSAENTFGLQVLSPSKDTFAQRSRQRPESSAALSPVTSAVDASSTTSLLPYQNHAKGKKAHTGSAPQTSNGQSSEVRPTEQEPVPDEERHREGGESSQGLSERMLSHLPTKVARFNLDDNVLDKQQRLRSRIHETQSSLNARIPRWHSVQEGELIRAQKMLVRVEETRSELPNDLGENESLKIEPLWVDKWREYLVACRRGTEDNTAYSLRLYKTRVIQNVENSRVKKSSCYEIPLNPKETKVNLFSALDKTVVVWHPYRRGSRIFILRPRSAAHAVEWYTFIRQSLGWRRPSSLLINVPDLELSLIFERPFDHGSLVQQRSSAGSGNQTKERFAADAIVENCMKMLEDKKEWAHVLRDWSKSTKMGLAWKRYDRLEWVHGSNERQMFGSIAMQTSHDLELRPKHHYPTTVKTTSHEKQTEPAPVEGFLALLTSQKGAQKRMGQMFFTRQYFSTSDHYLFFCKPAKAAPPQPPRDSSVELHIPSAREILDKMPSKYEVDPFPLENGQISWLNNGNKEFIRRHDEEAFAQLKRTLHNISNSDGFINLRYLREIKPAVENVNGNQLQNGSTRPGGNERADDTGNKVDARSQFLLVLDSGLTVRLQASNVSARDEWVARLRALVDYWRARLIADAAELKATRQHNLELLGVDEAMESILGQFAKKWEVKRAQASPHLYNMCAISGCRPIKVGLM